MPRILVIEDNEFSRNQLASDLEHLGFDVVAAANGKEGIEMTHSEAPDLIVMDLSMPDLNGWETSELLKADPETRRLPIIAITAHETPGDRQRLLESGCTAFHTKPVDLARLLESIEDALRNSAAPG